MSIDLHIMKMTTKLFIILIIWSIVINYCDAVATVNENEMSADYWLDKGKSDISDTIETFEKMVSGKAINVIIFIGAGMGITSLTAGRIFKGQREDYTSTGEEYMTVIDSMPYCGLAKTYSVDHQTADGAATATALLCGVKTNSGMIGVDASASADNCTTASEQKVDCVLKYAKMMGKSTGIVTTAAVQDATPAAAYATTVNKEWYTDADMANDAKAKGCKDIATQLVDNAKDINVVLGGGRAYMKLDGSIDREYPDHDSRGKRTDGVNLIEKWIEDMKDEDSKYVWTKDQFDAVKPKEVDYLLGLFQPEHMQYAVNRSNDRRGEPSLAEMTKKAIQILKRNSDGFFLLVEAGRLDHAHHENWAHVAMEEYLDFEESVKIARSMTSRKKTLIIVTADHGHVFTIGAGYPARGNPVTGLSPSPTNANQPHRALDGFFYTSSGYANGPGGFSPAKRPNVENDVEDDIWHRFQATVPLTSETHSSEDVVVFASGPMAHLVTGVHEQCYIAHLMFYAACMEPYADSDHCTVEDDVEQKYYEYDYEYYHPDDMKKKRSSALFH